MKRILYTLIALITISFFVYSQEDVEVIKDKINNIKLDKSSSYIFAEVRDYTQESAYGKAKKILNDSIKSWVMSTHPTADIKSVVAKIDSFTQDLTLRRGKRYHVFVYVNKDDIYALLPVNQVVIIPKDDVPEKAVSEVQKKDTGKKEQHNIPIVERPKEHVQKLTVSESISGINNNLITELLNVSHLSDAKKIIENEKYRKDYYYFKVNWQKDVELIKEKRAVMVIYNPIDETIHAIVKLDSNGTLKNLKTNQRDNISNYPDCFAISIIGME